MNEWMGSIWNVRIHICRKLLQMLSQEPQKGSLYDNSNNAMEVAIRRCHPPHETVYFSLANILFHLGIVICYLMKQQLFLNKYISIVFVLF